MASILAPDGSVTFIAALVVPLLLGFLVGVIGRAAVKIGVAIAVIVIILIVAGFITPSQVVQPIVQFVKGGPALAKTADRIAGYLPYSSLTFIVGFVVGFFKG